MNRGEIIKILKICLQEDYLLREQVRVARDKLKEE